MGDDQGGAAGVGLAESGQDLGGSVQAGHGDGLGGGPQGGRDGHLVAVRDPQPGGERTQHAGEPVRVGQQRPGRVRATPGPLGQRLGPGPQGGQLADAFTFRGAQHHGPFAQICQGVGGLLMCGGQLATVLLRPAAQFLHLVVGGLSQLGPFPGLLGGDGQAVHLLLRGRGAAVGRADLLA